MANSIPSRQLFIDGEWRESVRKNRIPVINPATEQIVGDIPAATSEDVDVAMEAARRALKRNGGKEWALASGAHRAKYLRAIAAKVIALVCNFSKSHNSATVRLNHSDVDTLFHEFGHALHSLLSRTVPEWLLIWLKLLQTFLSTMHRIIEF